MQLIEQGGLEAVSVREVAQWVGVSPGAPFRHFASRTALLTAVAEQAMDSLAEAVGQSLRGAEHENPWSSSMRSARIFCSGLLPIPPIFR